MHLTRLPLLLITLSLCTGTLLADTLIESVDQHGAVSRILISQTYARIDGADNGGYTLINFPLQQLFAINHAERVVLDLNSPPPSYPLPEGDTPPAAPPLPRIDVVAQGPGPSIIGHATTRYRVTADAIHCFDEYQSLSAIRNDDIRRLLGAVATASQPYQPVVLGAPIEKLPPCEAAKQLVDNYYLELGIPLRTVAPDGKVLHRITAIREVDGFAAGTFNFPAGYPQMTRQELFEENMRTIPSHQDANITMEDIGKVQQMIDKQISDMNSRRQAHPLGDQMRIKQNQLDTPPPAEHDKQQP
ncbi:MAG: hypothetical protein HY940_10270 [Gammaproteobacteria bacterium]|nr:hypothetical protein [Gammaproteobacteria bacterium]